MYAGVTRIEADPGRLDSAIAIYRSTIVPLVGQYAGSEGLLLLVERSTGKCLSVALWDTEAHAEAYESSGSFRAAVAQFGDAFLSPPTREVYEVSVQQVF